MSGRYSLEVTAKRMGMPNVLVECRSGRYSLEVGYIEADGNAKCTRRVNVWEIFTGGYREADGNAKCTRSVNVWETFNGGYREADGWAENYLIHLEE